MKKLTLCILSVFVGLILFRTTEGFAQETMEKEVVLWTAEDLKWEILNDSLGAMTALLWEDASGAHGDLTKFPAGFKAPLHYHTNDMKIVVIKGAYTYNGKEYGPGSYLFIPGGEQHESGGLEDSETIFFIEQPGKFDIVPVEN